MEVGTKVKPQNNKFVRKLEVYLKINQKSYQKTVPSVQAALQSFHTT